MKHAAKAYFRSSWKLVSIFFPFQGRKGGDAMLTEEEDISRARLWGHQQQWNCILWFGKENKITPSAYARLSTNGTLHLYDVPFSKSLCRLLIVSPISQCGGSSFAEAGDSSSWTWSSAFLLTLFRDKGWPGHSLSSPNGKKPPQPNPGLRCRICP